jgi:magnesium transporter
MLNLLPRETRTFRAVHALDLPADWRPPDDVIWIELISPERHEEAVIENTLRLKLPTSREMAQIEPSSRLYIEGGATFMTASLLSRSEEEHPVLTPVTFVLANGRLITLRYEPLRAFSAFSQRLSGPDYAEAAGADLFLDLLDPSLSGSPRCLSGDRPGSRSPPTPSSTVPEGRLSNPS